MPIIDQLNDLIKTGTEAEVRAFIIAHFSELPESMQKQLALEMFKDAMEEDMAEREQIGAMKKEVADAIDVIEKLEAQHGDAA